MEIAYAIRYSESHVSVTTFYNIHNSTNPFKRGLWIAAITVILKGIRCNA